MSRLLIITYYWPPAGGIGVQRCLKFAKYLERLGWDITVYTAKNADYNYTDPTNEKDVPASATILRHPIREPFSLYKKLTGQKKKNALVNPIHLPGRKQSLINKIAIWVRSNFFIPDARSLWIKPSVRYLSNYLKSNEVDLILSDGPPHTNTVIACRLSERFSIPWLADFQDPWTQVDYFKLLKLTHYARKKHHKLEQKTFEVADKITIASPSWGKELEEIGAKNVDTIYWGYDEDDFRSAAPKRDEKYTICHAGLFSFDRYPETLFKILGELCRENGNFGNDMRIRLAGAVDSSIIKGIEKNSLSENLELLGSISRDEALKMVRSARTLLLPLNKADNAKGRIPGKLFECIRSGNPILCLGPDDSDVSKIIEDTNSGKSFNYGDADGIKKYILEQYNSFVSGDNTTKLKNLEKYSVSAQVDKLSDYLNSIKGVKHGS